MFVLTTSLTGEKVYEIFGYNRTNRFNQDSEEEY